MIPTKKILTGVISISALRRTLGMGIFLGGLVALARADGIPYQTALDAAAVNEADVSNISTKGFVVGNGELNAIVYSSDNDIHLRVSKNDCWDMRIDTSADSVMPTVNPATQSFTTQTTGKAWSYPYPTALPCTDVTLAAVSGQTGWTSAKLDLAKAAATVVSDADTTTVRVLAQSNVILLDTTRALTFSGISGVVKDHSNASISGWVSAADTGTQGGYNYLHQNIPGDTDASGMDIYVVAGQSGAKQAIAVVTSRESATPLADAAALVTSTLADANAVTTHEAAWTSFWAKSGVSLGDATLQNWWYRMVYFFRCFARSGGNAIGLQACFDKLGGWHNSLKLNYNIQQTYLAAGPINHPELLEPFADCLNRNLSRAKWFATTNFIGCEGAFFHSDLWPFEPDPATCTTVNKHQQTYLPWGYTWGMDGHSATVLWDYYQYNPSAASLDRIWPLLREFATFYCSALEKCALSNGVRRIGPSYFPENGSYGQYNVCYDIAFINFCLKAARAAASLEADTALASRIDALLPQMPTYSTTTDSSQGGTVIEEWSGSGLQGADRHGTMVQPIFPAGEITWFSSDADKALFTRTIQRVENITTHANSNVTINIARARLGLGSDAVSNAKMCFGSSSSYSPEQPNGLFYWNAHGYYIAEQVCIARLVSELLLQSVGDVIRLFPAWPSGTDGSFSRLLAQGGFEVSAGRISDLIQNVTIKSTAGGSAHVSDPWPGYASSVVAQSSGASVPVSAANGILTFATTAGETYLLEQGAPTGPPAPPAGLQATAGNTNVLLSWSTSISASGYRVKRATTSGGPYTSVVDFTPGNLFVDSPLGNGQTFYYVVSALNAVGESADSLEVSATPTASTTLVLRASGGTASASAENLPNEAAAKAFDGSTSTKWYNGGSASTGWLAYRFASGAAWAITRYQIASANDVSQRDPKSWQFQGSNDGTNWTTLDTQTGQTFSARLQTKSYDITNTAPYRYYRLNITANSGGASYGLQLSEFALLSSPSDAGDKTPPVLAPTADIIEDADLASGARVSFAPTATDAVSGAATTVCEPASGSVFPIGTTTVICTATDLAGNTTTGSFTVTVRSTFTAFQKQNFNAAQLADISISGPSADPDGDGIPNLLEYATGGSPWKPNAAPTTQSAGIANAPLTLAFQRQSPAPVTYTVEASDDLQTWTSVAILSKNSDIWSGPASVSESGSGSSRVVTLTDVAAQSANARRFLRLSVAP